MRAWPLLLLLTGCTDRLISLRSEPSGATAYLDGKRVGKTPCEVPFTWYGDRELVVELEGYATKTQILEIQGPWWQWPILDFLTDVVLPIPFVDRREFSIVLEPYRIDPGQVDEVRRRAEELRRRTQESP